jgi:hypothetical protein
MPAREGAGVDVMMEYADFKPAQKDLENDRD